MAKWPEAKQWVEGPRPMFTVSADASAFFAAAHELVQRLAERWEDEHEYEAIEDYQAVLMPLATQHRVVIHSMTKRPFGFVFSTRDAGARRYLLTATRDEYTYERLYGGQ